MHNKLLAGVLSLYLLLAVAMSLTRLPICDEGWYGDPAVNLLSHGSMGSPAIESAGTFLQGIDRFTYWIMPVHILAQAAWYRLFGASLFSLRFLSVAAGLVILLAWYFVVLRLTARAGLAVLALLLVTVNPIFLALASTGRSDMLSMAFGAAALAAYLALRSGRLALAVVAANALVALSGLTHPIGGMVSFAELVWLEWYLDRKRFRVLDVLLGLVPYLAGAALWAVYILKAPDLFRAQFAGNSAERLWPLTSPLVALKREIMDRIIGAYRMGTAATRFASLRLAVLAAYVAAIAAFAGQRQLRRSQAGMAFLPMLGLVFVVLWFFEGAKQPWYLVHFAVPGAVILAGALIWYGARHPTWRPVLDLAVLGIVCLELGYPALSIMKDRYRRTYLPLVRAVQAEARPGTTVMGSVELGFGIGFDRVLDDRYLGFYSHKTPELIVLDPRYRDYFQQAEHDRPHAYRYMKALLSSGYRQVFSNGYYSLLSSPAPAAGSRAGQREAGPGTLKWVTGYWYSPTAWGNLPVADIDYAGLTHIVHYALLPTGDGGFEASSLEYITSYSADLVRTAHRHHVKVLLGVAQTKPGGDFLNSTAPAVLPTFIDNILHLVGKYGYDGVDLDWENGVDAGRFQALVKGLRRRLDALHPNGLLTGAFWEARYVAPVCRDFDQINLMAYDGSSVARGFSWHNAALYSGADKGRPSANWGLRQFLAPPASIPPAKMGLGIPFYGYIWKGGAGTPTGGITAPGQTWTRPPVVHTAPYKDIVRNHSLWRKEHHHRDERAGVPFLSIDRPGADDDVFVTYDDETSIAAKVAYAKAKGLGGIMLYDLSGDYLPQHHPQHPLMQAVEKAVRAGNERCEESPREGSGHGRKR